jgi:O-antigen/teichoic acid export membrane protein
MSLLKKLAGETAIYGISSILSRLLHYVILTPFFTRAFETGEYGVVSNMYTWAALLMVLFTYRMETAFFRYGSKNNALDKVFSTASISLLASTIVFVLIMISFAQPIASWLHYPDHVEYVIWFTLIIGFDALAAVPFAKLRLENRPIRFAIIKTLNIIINIIFIFFFLKLCPYLIEQGYSDLELIYNEENRIEYVFISNLLASATVILLLIPAYFKIKLKFDADLWRKMIVYALPLVIVGIAAVVNQLIGIPMLIEFLPGSIEENHDQAGIYSAAAKLAVLMNLFTQAFNYAAEPFFFRNAERSDSQHIYAQVGQAFAIVGSLVFLGIMLYLDIIQYFLGKEFRGGLGVVPILLLAYLFLGLYYNFSIWYKLADRTIFGAYIASGGALITIALNVLLIQQPDIAYYGPAWAALACYFFMAMASYWTGQRHYPIHYPMQKIFTYILLAIAAYGLSLLGNPLWKDAIFVKLLVNTSILFIYLFALYLLEKNTAQRWIASFRK